MSKAKYYSRSFLNKKEGTAFIESSIELTDYCVYADVAVADCNRKVTLDFGVYAVKDYDLVRNDGITIDVKTKQTSAVPLPHYECSVAALNTKQACDYYCFVRVKNDFTVGWYLGVVRKQDSLADAVFMKKGTVDPSNNYVVKSDCFNMKITSLKEHIYI